MYISSQICGRQEIVRLLQIFAADEENLKKIIGLLFFLLVSLVGNVCAETMDNTIPLWNEAKIRNKIIVVSDIHLGVDDSFSETVKNKALFVDFLKHLQNTVDIKELVIDGDFLDEWYLPMNYPSYSDSDEFYQKCIANNQNVIDELKHIMASGIKLVYVPGNHDLLLDPDILEKALPGIVQARDARGLGVYYTGEKQNIAIEHGHRYDVFSAPDNVSNKVLCGNDDTILPPGYFYARYAASWVTEGRPVVTKNYPTIEKVPDQSDADQYGAYLYYAMLNAEFSRMTPTESFENKVFDMKIAGFNDTYSVQDMFPVLQPDGTISAPILYKDFQRTWDARQKENLVAVPVSFGESVFGALGFDYLAQQAKKQYLENQEKNIDVVVFGHSHIPHFLSLDNGKTYLNSGTWVDNNTSTKDQISRTFIIIEDGEKLNSSIFEYLPNGNVNDITRDMIR